MSSAPLGAASLLGHLHSCGIDDFDFVDLRLWASYAYAPTYRPVGVYGETYVLDVPDLPIVLSILSAWERRVRFEMDATRLESFALERGIGPRHLHKYLRDTQTMLEVAFEQMPNLQFVGFSCWTSNLATTLMAASILKRRARPPYIVLGGPQVTESRNSAALALRSMLADAVVLGEGEETLRRLFDQCRRTSGSPGTVEGALQLGSNGTDLIGGERPLMPLPTKSSPDFSRMPIMQYQNHGLPLRLLPLEMSRGCTDKCTFCSEWVFWRRFRTDTVGRVVEQATELVQRYQIDAVWFSDSLLNGVKERLVGLAEGFLDSGIGLKWGGFMRANMDRATAALIKRAGCEYVFLGIESLSDETLHAMNKRRTRSDNLRAISALLDAGVSAVVAGVIPGFPGDTRERFVATVAALAELRREYPKLRINIEPFVVSPGQPLFGHLEENGLVAHRWRDDVLDICMSHRDITGSIVCSVTGANQGMDRLGALRLVTAVAESADAGLKDPYLYATAEDIVATRIAYRHLEGHWQLGLFKSSAGLRCGVLVSRDERNTWESQVHHSPEEDVETFARTLVDRHVVPPSMDRPKLRYGSQHIEAQHARNDGEKRVMLSPFVVCRYMDDGSDRVLVADIVRGSHGIVEGTFAALLQLLDQQGSDIDGVIEWTTARGLAPDSGQRFWARLQGLGFLVDLNRSRKADSWQEMSGPPDSSSSQVDERPK